MHARRWAVILGGSIVWLLFSLPGSAQKSLRVPAKPAAIFSQIDNFTADLSEITGWRVRRKVPSEIVTKAKFQSYLQSHTRDASHQKEVHAEETALKMLGLVPADFDLVRQTEDLLGEQAAAYYDYKKKRLYILDSTPEGDDQRMALVHELAHALADQQHSLGKYLDQAAANSDASTAREAVMEGQATWLTWAYEAKRVGRKAEVPEGMIEQLTREEPNAEFPVLSAAPLYMRESLLFPYNAGAKFQDAVYRDRGRSAFDAVFATAPRNTHQVIHPGDYLTGKGGGFSVAPSYELLLGERNREFRGVIESYLGEFDHAVLLRQYAGESIGATAAAHLQGSGFRLYEHKREKYPVLAYWSEWDSPEAARVFFDLYQKVMRAKWKKLEIASAKADELEGAGDSGKFRLRISGRVVQALEGLK